MSERKPPRYQGRITTWKDDQGYGFITPNGGGPAVFVHIASFSRRGIRPAENDIVTYRLGANEKGQPRAQDVAFARERVVPRPAGSNPLVDKAGLVSGTFIAFLAVLVVMGKLSLPLLCVYLGMSLVTFVTYAFDKAAAERGRWRISEARLHMLSLLGGWPGALLAQGTYRHKSKKQSFQATFWTIVLLHCVALGFLLAGFDFAALRYA